MIRCAVHRDRHAIPNGPFIDEVSTSLETYSYYSSRSRAKSLGKYVVLNPGTNIDPRSFNIAYKIVALEPPLEEYVNFSYLDYSSAVPDRVRTIVLNTPSDKVDYVVQKAVANGSKRVYVHDGADERQTGDPAYFYLSPYLMIPAPRFQRLYRYASTSRSAEAVAGRRTRA
jgi:hypothetical protein